MKTERHISGYSYIKPNTVIVNGLDVNSSSENLNASDFITSLYQQLKPEYPKFFKMDSLSKLGFVSAEAIFKNKELLKKYTPEEIGVVLSNRSASLDTDLKYNEMIIDDNNYFPSPAVFVYTLANIVTGEICIRHKLKGENAFFISDNFDPDFLYTYVNNLFEKNKIKACLAGWIDLKDEHYESFLIFVESKELKGTNSDKTLFTNNNLSNIYHKFHGRINQESEG
jgi:hypothetical protein